MKGRLLAGCGLISALALARSVPAEDRPPARETAALGSLSLPALKVLDLEGRVHAIGSRPTVLVFMGTECPIANRYIPELNALARARAEQGVAFYGVLSERRTSRAAALEHRRQLAVEFPEILDASGGLAAQLHPTHTPEAFLLAASGSVVYRGRIDDAYADLGKPRGRPPRKDLDEAIGALLAGKAVPTPRTTPVGCDFEGWGGEARLASVTYARDVAPILNANCVACHRAGGIAPFALSSFEDASRHARTIARVTRTRYMPPWHAEPGHGHFEDERRLSERDIEVLGAWAGAGSPRGNDADLPAPPTFASGWQLGEPDLVVSMPEAFEVPAAGKDIYRAFVLKTDIPEDKMVVGVEFRPGAPTVVHHCITYLDANGVARELEKRAGGFGYPSFGGPGFLPTGDLGGWAPGVTPRFLPEGIGRRLGKGSDIVIQLHYHPSGKPEHDRSSLALYFAKKPVKQVLSYVVLGNGRIDIPAGERRYERSAGLTLPVDVTLIGVTPHMHLIGREMRVTATLPSGEVVPLIWIKDWDFRWQDQYQYASPLRVPAGTRLHLDAVYDNSSDNPANPNDPPRRVRRGEQTTDEMCLCFFSVALDRTDDFGKILQAMVAERRKGEERLRKRFF